MQGVMGLYYLAIHVFHREQYATQCAVGYSCVVFGCAFLIVMQFKGSSWSAIMTMGLVIYFTMACSALNV